MKHEANKEHLMHYVLWVIVPAEVFIHLTPVMDRHPLGAVGQSINHLNEQHSQAA